MVLKYVLLAFFGGLTLLPGRQTNEFPYAVANRGCTQEDAPALEVYLTRKPFNGAGQPAKPYLRIEVGGRNWQNLLRKELQLLPLSRRGIDREKPLVRAELNLAGQKQTVWLRGTLKLTKLEAEKGVEGSYDFSGPGERKWKGAFKASWTKGSGGCG